MIAEGVGLLLQRFQALPDDAGDDVIDALAADYVRIAPRPQTAPPPIDLDTMDKLMGDRLSPAQRRCLHRVRQLFEERDG